MVLGQKRRITVRASGPTQWEISPYQIVQSLALIGVVKELFQTQDQGNAFKLHMC